MNAVFLDSLSVGDDISLQLLHQSVDSLSLFEFSEADQIIDRIADAEVVIANKSPLTQEVISKCPKLKLICVAATGFNNVDIVAAQEHGVQVRNVTGYASDSVAQYVMSSILLFASPMTKYHSRVTAGEWSAQKQFSLVSPTIFELKERTLGLVGSGQIGQKVKQLAEAFGMKVIFSGRKGLAPQPGKVAFDLLLQQADFISLHCPLNKDTHHLISENELALMKSSSVLINTARGDVVDQSALIQSLKTADIGAAVIDVFDQEPPSLTHPLLKAELDNLILTPHCAWASVEARQLLVDEIARNIDDYKAGGRRNTVAAG